jgi:DNA polymerase III subunit gamma/tau
LLANKYRPQRFEEVVGQDSGVEVLHAIVRENWSPFAILYSGPFGTGKTTLARLTAKALLCSGRNGGVEPCCECDSCVSVVADNNPGYVEIDAASRGLVEDVRTMRDDAKFKTIGTAKRIICYDEAHMLSGAAQNALLRVLEEGAQDLIYMFCTTAAEKLLPTIRSRCVSITMGLLTVEEIAGRLKAIADAEEVVWEEKAVRVLATYVRGHVRDAIMTLEQVIKTVGSLTEAGVRVYLRLDRYVSVYKFLTSTDRKEGLELLEGLLCEYGPGDLGVTIGQILLNAWRKKVGAGDFTQVDSAWLDKVLVVHGEGVLAKAETVLALKMDFSTIDHGLAAIGRIFLEADERERAPSKALTATVPAQMRKPGMEKTVS